MATETQYNLPLEANEAGSQFSADFSKLDKLPDSDKKTQLQEAAKSLLKIYGSTDNLDIRYRVRDSLSGIHYGIDILSQPSDSEQMKGLELTIQLLQTTINELEEELKKK